MKTRALRVPVLVLLSLFLTAGALAAVGDTGFSDLTETVEYSDMEVNETLQDQFGSDIDDEGSSAEEFGEDTQDESEAEEDTSSLTADDFGEDTDDDGSSVEEFGEDTEDEGSSREEFGEDTEDEGSSREEFGEDIDDSGAPVNEDENETVSEEQVTELVTSVNPRTLVLGETASVTGSAEGLEGEQLTVTVNGETLTTEQLGENNSEFETEFTPEETGIHEIQVSAGDFSETHTVDVISTVDIQSVNWPNSVDQGESFQVCPQIASETEAEVKLFRDGIQLDSRTGTSEVCFTTEIHDAGTHQLTVEATVHGDRATETSAVDVQASVNNMGNDHSNTGAQDGNDTGMLGAFLDSASANIGLLLLALAAIVFTGYLYRGRGQG